MAPKNKPIKKLQVKVEPETKLMSSVKMILGMAMMLFVASMAIAGILTWYIFQ